MVASVIEQRKTEKREQDLKDKVKITKGTGERLLGWFIFTLKVLVVMLIKLAIVVPILFGVHTITQGGGSVLDYYNADTILSLFTNKGTASPAVESNYFIKSFRQGFTGANVITTPVLHLIQNMLGGKASNTFFKVIRSIAYLFLPAIYMIVMLPLMGVGAFGGSVYGLFWKYLKEESLLAIIAALILFSFVFTLAGGYSLVIALTVFLGIPYLMFTNKALVNAQYKSFAKEYGHIYLTLFTVISIASLVKALL